MKNKIKAVIFDMDGVIVDSEPIHSKSWEKVLLERGISPVFNKSGLIHEAGDTSIDGYQRILDRHNLDDDPEIIKKRRREIFIELIKQKTDPMHGFTKLIKILKDKKIKTAVASSRFLKHVELILSNLKVVDLFEVIIGHIPDLKRKPAPDIYLYAAKKLGVKPKECVAIEDSEIGVLSAINAGIKVIAIPNKYTKHQNFSKADKIVKNLEDVNIPLLMSLRET